MKKKFIALSVIVPIISGSALITGVWFAKPSLLSHLPFTGENAKTIAGHDEVQRTEADAAIMDNPHDDQDIKIEEHPDALKQSSAEQVVVTAASDFVKPKSQTSRVVKVMREISALQGKMSQGVAGSPQALKESMLRAEKVFMENDHTLESGDEIQSLAQYVLSGGSPAAASKALRNTSLSVQHKDLIQGVLSYATADLTNAREKLLPLDGKRFNTLLNAQLSMVQVQLDEEVETDKNLERLSYAANIVPGTLIEEAAIRRMIPLLAHPRHSERLLYWTERYFRRFSKSLYYQDFETGLINTLIKVSAAEPRVENNVLMDILAGADAQQAASVSSKMLLIAVQSGNSLLCGEIQNSLENTSSFGVGSFADTKVLIEICKAAEGKTETLEGLQNVNQSNVSEAVKINLNKAIELAEAIKKDVPLNDDGRFGPYLPLSASVDYISLFASVAQQIDTSVSAIKKADDHETSFNE